MPNYGTFKNQFDGIIEKFMNLYKTKEWNASPIIDILQFNQGNLTLRSSESRHIKHDPRWKAQNVKKRQLCVSVRTIEEKAAATVQLLQPTTLEDAYQ